MVRMKTEKQQQNDFSQHLQTEQTTTAQLRHLTEQLIWAQEDERHRVSRELHDEAGQSLTALRISLQLLHNSLENEKLQQQIADAIEITEQTMTGLWRLAHDLHPPELDTFGLHATLEEYCDWHSQHSQLAIFYRGEEISDLSRTLRITFYRFVQEALTNVTKHAAATEVYIWLRKDAGKITLQVCDNGQGIPPNYKKGLGLLGLKERFANLHGSLSIDSVIGQGTTLIGEVSWNLTK
jgi:signal transduction histidine kinase